MQSIGISFDGNEINIAILSKNNDLIHLQTLNIQENSTSSYVKDLNKNKDKKIISTCLDCQDVLIRTAFVDIKKSFFLKKIVKFQNDLISTIDPSSRLSCFIKQNSYIKFFITTKNILKRHLNNLKKFNIDPDYVTCIKLALCHFANHYFHVKTAFLIHIGLHKTFCIFMNDQLPEKFFVIKIGAIKLCGLNNNDYKKAKKIDLSLIKTDNNYCLEFKKSIENVCKSLAKDQEKKYPMIITGNTENLLNIENFLLNEKISEVMQSTTINKNPLIKNHAINIGLAIHSNSKNNKIQFRQNEFTPSKTIEKYRNNVFLFVFLSIFCCFLMHFGSNYFFIKKEKKLYERLKKLEIFEKNGSNIDKITKNTGFYNDLEDFDAYLGSQIKNFPYFLKVPNVNQTLSWLNTHENLKQAEIIFFNYSLDEYPNVFSKNNPYVAKVELEFKTKTPAIARSFYDSLLKGEGYANPNLEITWEVENNSYKTSFYLKD